jgi:hypothetical protein
MLEHEINRQDNFISGWYIDNDNLCDRLIGYHSINPSKFTGTIGRGVDLDVKNSTDCRLLNDDPELFTDYYSILQKCADQYIKKYTMADRYSAWRIGEPAHIQHYTPDGGFYTWHAERTNTMPNIITRHLVFMTYLNNITDGGETEWYYQKIKIKPEKGLTVIWPADWTFTHRGIPSPTQDKYIITGWYNFYDSADL